MRREIRPTARAVIALGDHLLLGRGEDEMFYHLPGGGIDRGEAPEQSLRRELGEELGRRITTLDFVMLYRNIYTKGEREIHERLHLFEATLLPVLVENPPMAREAWMRFEWVPVAELTLRDVRPAPLVALLVSMVAY